jgi:hypothetical protein
LEAVARGVRPLRRGRRRRLVKCIVVELCSGALGARVVG